MHKQRQDEYAHTKVGKLEHRPNQIENMHKNFSGIKELGTCEEESIAREARRDLFYLGPGSCTRDSELHSKVLRRNGLLH